MDALMTLVTWAALVYLLIMLTIWIALIPFCVGERLGFWGWIRGAFWAGGWPVVLIWAYLETKPTKDSYVVGSKKLKRFMEENSDGH